MAYVIAVYSMKGGVGKTTLAVNLACSAALSSYRTLLWEIDAQGSASFLLGHDGAGANAKRVFSRDLDPAELIEPTRWPDLDLLGADLSMRQLDHALAEADKPKRLRKLLQRLMETYELIVLDCPPGLGEVSDQVFRAVDLIVVPVPPTPLAQRALQQVSEHIDSHHGGTPPLLPVFSMVDRRKKLHRETVEAHPDWPVIPQASIIERMAIDRIPVVAKAKTSAAAGALTDLWDSVERRLGAAPGRKAKVPRLPRKRP